MAGNKSIEEWKKTFISADRDNSGSLDICELRELLKRGNSKLSDRQIAEFFIAFDGEKGDRRITLDEFINGLRSVEEYIGKVTALFKSADRDNSGFVDKNELKQICHSCNSKMTDADIDEILRQADKSGDDLISLQEFLNACT